MNRGSHAGFCTFDERNAGGRYQTQAELKRFKHVLSNTKSTVDHGDKGERECMRLLRSFEADRG